ncbi:MAG: ROK family protein [Endomicrobium sp.]|jgi:glucokinase|nr:ROK family protein [Endomicrobium sp.]
MKKILMYAVCFSLFFALDANGRGIKEEGLCYLGVDIGGTSTKIAIVNSRGGIKEDIFINTNKDAEPEEVIETIVKAASKLKDYSKVEKIGVGIAGDIDYEKGIVRFSPNLPKWKQVPLKEMLEKSSKKKVIVDNDANVASIGAFWLDAKGEATNLICITLGTGVGGGLIFNKELYRGSSGTAGEIGHITIFPNGSKCNCGNKGCVEALIGANYLSKHAVNYLKKHKSPVIDKLTGKNYSQITPKLIFEAAQSGDDAAKELCKRMGKNLGILLADIINFVNPDTIVICGGMTLSSKNYMDYALDETKKRAFKSALEVCKIVISKNTDKLGVVGAAMLSAETKKQTLAN